MHAALTNCSGGASGSKSSKRLGFIGALMCNNNNSTRLFGEIAHVMYCNLCIVFMRVRAVYILARRFAHIFSRHTATELKPTTTTYSHEGIFNFRNYIYKYNTILLVQRVLMSGQRRHVSCMSLLYCGNNVRYRFAFSVITAITTRWRMILIIL